MRACLENSFAGRKTRFSFRMDVMLVPAGFRSSGIILMRILDSRHETSTLDKGSSSVRSGWGAQPQERRPAAIVAAYNSRLLKQVESSSLADQPSKRARRPRAV